MPEGASARGLRETVIHARFADLEGVFQLLKVMHAEVGQQSFNEPRVRAWIKDVLDNGVILLAMEGTAIAGTMGVQPGQWPWTDPDEWHLQERWTFVHPDYRRSRHARNMIEAAKGAARHLGIPLVAGVFSDKDHERKIKLFERQLPRIGAVFFWKPEPAA